MTPAAGQAVQFRLDDGTIIAGHINHVWSTVCVNVTLFPVGDAPRHIHSVGWFPTFDDMARAMTTYGVVPLPVVRVEGLNR
jgi:hypothetical protein